MFHSDEFPDDDHVFQDTIFAALGKAICLAICELKQLDLAHKTERVNHLQEELFRD